MVADYICLLESGSTMPHRGIALPPVALFVAFRCCVAPPHRRLLNSAINYPPLPTIKPPETRPPPPSLCGPLLMERATNARCGVVVGVTGRSIAAARIFSLDDFPGNSLLRLLPIISFGLDASSFRIDNSQRPLISPSLLSPFGRISRYT